MDIGIDVLGALRASGRRVVVSGKRSFFQVERMTHAGWRCMAHSSAMPTADYLSRLCPDLPLDAIDDLLATGVAGGYRITIL